jgi:hypothetical protein
MQQNIGMLDRYLRLLCGLVAFGAGAQMKRGSSFAKGALLTFGAMKIAEGVTGWCPIMHACGVRSNDDAFTTQKSSRHRQDEGLRGKASHSSYHHGQDSHQESQHERHLSGSSSGGSHQHVYEFRHESHGESDSNQNKSPEHAINESFGTPNRDKQDRNMHDHVNRHIH